MMRAILGRGLRLVAPTFLTISLLLSNPASAMAAQHFDAVAFAAAQKADRPILVDVTASWCPVCQIQGLIIKRAETRMPQVFVFTIDFDDNPDLLKRFGVSYQSTLIVFKGAKEVARSIGDTNEDRVDALIQQGL